MLLPAALQEVASGDNIGLIGAGIAIGGAVIGAGLGISPIGSAAASGIARQPEAGNQIQTAAIIFAALVEGTALFGLGLVFLLFA
ncbi:MAG: ATP synthase F0 subunit C [Gammaproteobacteria bacterium]|nr:ATP synthase F0 subunit C [Gammaproteobacteria bacterium]MDE0246996.1 ATP synthase F0 subunit C [Gammaproteobacteria bacterium]